jgi:outer membrane lipoprotein-sorting protein
MSQHGSGWPVEARWEMLKRVAVVGKSGSLIAGLALSAPLALTFWVAAASAAWTVSDSTTLIGKIEKAYASVEDYRANLLIEGFGQDSSYQETHELLYTYKKPNRVRIDFQRPHRGMVIAYPDANGKAVVRIKPWASFLTFHLDPDSSFLEVSPGQQINQTDLGLLIRNIAHSLTDMLIGDLEVTFDEKHVVVRVLSDNPFRRGDPTRYEFLIDRGLWLPVGVRELSSQGVLRRTVTYKGLLLNGGVPDSFFQLD